MTALFSADDYTAAALAMMPRGAVWPKEADSEQGRTLAALALALWRSDGVAQQLLLDAFPGTTEALLPEWEASLGLPDPALEAGATDDQRRAFVLARLTGASGQSRARFIAFAAGLGFTIVITNYVPLTVDNFVAGSAVYDLMWANSWAVHVTANTGGLSTATLLAELNAIKPADTTIVSI